MNNLLFDFWLAWVNASNLKYLGCGLIKCPSNLGAASQLGEAERDMGEKMNAEANLPKWKWLLTASKFFP
jgi:hypothetical protein